MKNKELPYQQLPLCIGILRIFLKKYATLFDFQIVFSAHARFILLNPHFSSSTRRIIGSDRINNRRHTIFIATPNCIFTTRRANSQQQQLSPLIFNSTRYVPVYISIPVNRAACASIYSSRDNQITQVLSCAQLLLMLFRTDCRLLA